MKIVKIHKREIIQKPKGVKLEHLGKDKNVAKIIVGWRQNFTLGKSIGRGFDEFAIIAIAGESIGYLINKSIITLDDQMLKIEHKPLDSLPWTYLRKDSIKGFRIDKIQLGEGELKVMEKLVGAKGLFADLNDGQEALLFYNMKMNTLRYLAQELEILLDVDHIIPTWES